MTKFKLTATELLNCKKTIKLLIDNNAMFGSVHPVNAGNTMVGYKITFEKSKIDFVLISIPVFKYLFAKGSIVATEHSSTNNKFLFQLLV